MTKKKFRVPVKYEIPIDVNGFITIEAESVEEAISKAEKQVENIGLTCEAIRNSTRDNNSFIAEDVGGTAYEYLRRGYVAKFIVNTDCSDVEEIEEDES